MCGPNDDMTNPALADETHPFALAPDSVGRCRNCGGHWLSAVHRPESPAEVWCVSCDQPSVTVHNGEAYCASCLERIGERQQMEAGRFI